MADIKLMKPQAGERVSIQSAPDARLEFAFSTADAVLEKSGNDLVFTFDDGSSLVLTDFYTAYTKENLPEFVVEGQTIAGSDFFAALGNDDLMPAAGPAARAPAGGRFREYDESSLMDGIDRLDGLDLGWQPQPLVQDDLLAAGPGFLGTDGADITDGPDTSVNLPPELVPPSSDPLSAVEAGVKKGGNEVEDGVPSVSGKVDAVDPEGDALNFYFIDADGNKVSSITTEYGTITIDSDGNYSYTLNNNGAANGLAADDSFSEKFTVGVSDSKGNTSSGDVTIDIKGTNDQPTLELSETVLNVAEDGGITGSVDKNAGLATGADVDSGAELSYSFTQPDGTPLGNTLTDTYGSFTLDPSTGEYTYTLNNDSLDVQKLGEGVKVEQKFTIRVQDEHGAWSEQEVTVVITGSNDAPTVTVDNAHLDVIEAGVKDGGNDLELGTPSASGKVTGSDVDEGDTQNLSYGVQGGTTAESGKVEVDSPYGKFVLDPTTGEYTYTLDNDASNSLSSGETREETFTVTVSDGKGGTAEQEITVTVTGTNDAPVLTIERNAGDDHVLKEDGSGTAALTASGTFTTVDVDSDGDVQNYSIKAGHQTEQARGTTAEDGHDEAGTANDSSSSFTSLYGTLVLNMDGTYTFTLNNESTATQSLAAGKTHTDNFVITVTDKHGATHEQTISVKIEGTNDAPILTPKESTLVLKESGVARPDGDPNGDGNTAVDGKLQATGKIDVKDIDVDQADPGPNFFFTVTLADGAVLDGKDTGNVFELQYGTLTINQDGTYTYTLNDAAVNDLNQGGTLHDDISVTVRDKHDAEAEGKQDIKIVIEGTNDKPLLTLNGEDAGASHTMTDPGKDASDLTVEGSVGIVDPDKGYEHTITITGKGDTTGTAEAGKNVEGTEGDSAAKFTTDYGTLTVDPATGKYVYTLNADSESVRKMAEGEKHTEKFTIRVQDEHGAWSEQEITIDITGTNDNPTVDVDDAKLNLKEGGVKDGSNTTEYGEGTVGGKVNADDVDTPKEDLTFEVQPNTQAGGDTNVISSGTENGVQTIVTDYGTLTLNTATGEYSYSLNQEAPNSPTDRPTTDPSLTDKLSQGEKRTEHFTVTVSDGKGGTTTQDITVEIEGTNDRPLLNLNPYGGTVKEDSAEAGRVDGVFTVADEDNDAGTDRTFTISGGKNDSGTMTSGTLTSTGHTDDDPNTADTSAVFKTAYGTLTVNPDGNYSYVLNNGSSAVQKLGAGQSHQETFWIKVTDEHGATSEKPFTIDIKGTNDAPTLTPKGFDLTTREAGVGRPENNPAGDGNTAVAGQKASGSLFVNDVDTGDKLTYILTYTDDKGVTHTLEGTPTTGAVHFTTEHGTFSVWQNGNFTYTPNDKDSTVNGLAPGMSLNEKLNVQVKDQHGALSNNSQDINITINGTNDKPTLTVSQNSFDRTANQQGGEDITVGGRFTIVDPEKANGDEHTITIAGGKDTTGEAVTGYDKAGTANDANASFTTEYGTLTLDPMTGTYTYVLNAESDAVLRMTEKDSHKETFTITVTDKWGAHHEQTITIDIKGTNDKPVLEPVKDLTLNLKEVGIKDSDDWGKDSSGNIIQNEGERGKVTAGGKLDISDVDKGDSFQFYITYVDSKGNLQTSTSMGGPNGPFRTEYGLVTIQQDGTFTYNLNESTTNSLKQGEILNNDFTIHVKDKSGAEADKSQDVKVVIEGTNDKPTLTLNGKDGGASHSLTEPGKDADDMSVGGSIKIIDPDHDATHDIIITDKNNPDGKGQNGHDEAGTANDSNARFETAYGTLTIDPATGKYLYTLDSDSEAVRKLAAGEKYTEKFTIRVQDEHGAWHEQEITVDITGTNDAPIVKPSDLVIQEDNGQEYTTLVGNISKGGAVEASDVEGDKLRYNLVDDNGGLRQTVAGQGGVDQDGNPVTGEYGYLTLNPVTGKYEYTLFNDSPLVQSMGEGDSITQTFTVRVSDGKGGFTEETITVTIKGTNDLPNLTGNTAGVVEDGGALARPDLPGETPTNPTASGKLEIADIDTTDEKSFTLTGNGAVTNGDGSMTIDGKHGTLTLNPDGSYTYELTDTGEDLQGKNVNEWFATEEFNVDWQSGKDKNSTTIKIDIKGSNDKPLLDVQQGDKGEVITSGVIHQNGTETGKVTADDIDNDNQDLTFRIMNQYDKDGNPVQGGSFTDTTGKEPAPGAGDNHWQPEQTGNGLYGSLTINPDGTYTYTLNVFDRDAMDAYFKANPDADSIKETFTVTVTDPHGATDTKEITVSVPKDKIPGMGEGSGNVPEPDHTVVATIESTDPIKVGEDSTLNASGKVSIKVSCDSDGAGHDGDHKGEFLFAFKDADGNYVQTISDQYGSITINPITGEYTYTLNNDSKFVQEMNEGESWKPELPPVYVVNGPDKNGNWTESASGKIDVTIEGTNDAPIIDSVQNLSVNENHTGTISGSVKAHDVDSGGEQGDSLSYNFSYKGTAIGEGGVETPYGKLTVNADGSYSFTLDPSKAQSLGQGASEQVKFTVSVTDEHGATVEKNITIDIKGTNDAPTLEFAKEGDANLVFTEDSGANSLKGKVIGEDVDAGDTLRYSITNDATGATSGNILTGTCGTMVLNPKTGEYEYKLDPDSKAVQQLGEGEEYTETYTITVSDGKGGTHSETITITVKGTNDAPEMTLDTKVLNVTEDAAGMEQGTAIAFGKATVTDVDAKDELSFGLKAGDGEANYTKNADGSVSIQGLYGMLTIAADGSYTYTPTEGMQALGKGDTSTDKFTIFVNDGKGGVVEQPVDVNVKGSNDAPVVDVDQSILHRDLVEVPGGKTETSGKLVATDADGDKLTFSSGHGQYGTVSITANGEYTYTLKQGVNFPDEALGHDKFTITIKDGKGGVTTQDISIDLTGKNDLPVLNENTSDLHQDLVETDNGFPAVDGKLNVTDADQDTLHYSIADEHAPQFGTVTIEADGSYHYTLNEGYSPDQGTEDTFTVTIDDGHGGTLTQEVTIGITPQPEPAPMSASAPEVELVESIGLFTTEGDEDLFMGSPLEHSAPLFQGLGHYGTENESDTGILAADLFPRGQEENMDSLLDTLSQGSNTVASADLPAPEASAEVPAAEAMDMAASLPHADAMAEATALAAHKIVLENNG